MDGTACSTGVRAFFAALFAVNLAACAHVTPRQTDPHYTDAGYFDIYVCHWPDRPLFLVGLFGTTRADEIKAVEVIRPDGKRLGNIALARYEVSKDMNGAERRAYKTQFPPDRSVPNGWYQAVITMKNGRQWIARDYVEIRTMPLGTGLEPQGSERPLAQARTLRWKPVAGNVFYRVTIQDMWQDKALIYTSDLVREPRLTVPPGVLVPGGSYIWRVHVRQQTDDPKWGDFNHGSKSAETVLSVAP